MSYLALGVLLACPVMSVFAMAIVILWGVVRPKTEAEKRRHD